MRARARIWHAIRSGQRFTMRSIATASDTRWASARFYVDALARAGLVERVEVGANRVITYRLAHDTGLDAPRVDAATGVVHTGARPRTRVWHAARVMRRFSAADLAATADVTITVANKYIQLCNAAGYLRQLENYAGAAHRKRTYALVRDPGPYALAYCVATHTATDPNTGEVFAL